MLNFNMIPTTQKGDTIRCGTLSLVFSVKYSSALLLSVYWQTWLAEKGDCDMPKYKGSFCWHGEDHVLYTSVTTKRQAFQQLCHQLARKLEYSQRHIAMYFKDEPNKYRIEKVVDQ